MYIKIENGAIASWPYSLDTLLQEHPTVSFPLPIPNETLEKYGVYEVENVLAPLNDDETKKIMEGLPQLHDGVWKRYYEIVALDDAEMNNLKENKRIGVRYERDRLLQATDWTQCKDIPDEVSDKYTAYRQALRDITLQEGFPMNVEWPSMDQATQIAGEINTVAVGPIEPDSTNVYP
jgi:hypothetical protein